ncbi:MAG: fasciclin domain-containing protein [Salinarimonas sp.]
MNTILARGAAAAFAVSLVAAPAFAQEQTIVALASADENLSTLVTAVQEANLVDTLSGDGPFTVFAPTNAAFEALPEGALDSLLADQAQLSSTLMYHVVAGEVMAADLMNQIEAGGGEAEIETAGGETLTANVEGGEVMLTDKQGNTVTVTQADIDASNGVVHVIDGVLMPAM